MRPAKRKIDKGTSSFIIGGSYLAAAAVNLLFFEKAVGVILLIMGALDMIIGLAVRKKGKESLTDDRRT